MSKYQKGKIYIITGSESNKVYLGSTIMTLKRRLSGHREGRGESSKEILLNKDFNIVLLETYPCNNNKELLWRERYWYDELRPMLVNVRPPINSDDENKKKYKEWFKNNKDYYKINRQNKNYHKEYYAKNKIMITKKSIYINSWGGDIRIYNNLLKISLDVFE